MPLKKGKIVKVFSVYISILYLYMSMSFTFLLFLNCIVCVNSKHPIGGGQTLKDAPLPQLERLEWVVNQFSIKTIRMGGQSVIN